MLNTNTGVPCNTNITYAITAPGTKISTTKLAQKLDVEPQTIRAGYCRKGHYLGLIPVVLPNGHLRWDDGDSDRVLIGKPPIGGNLNNKRVNSERSAKAREAAAKSLAVRREKRLAEISGQSETLKSELTALANTTATKEAL